MLSTEKGNQMENVGCQERNEQLIGWLQHL
jgi:hypothetical protein